jgi:PrsW family intramembrane metalloprotease
MSMDQTPLAKDEKRSLGPIPAVVVVILGAIVAMVVISVIGLFLRLLLGISLVGIFSPFYEEPLKALGLIALALFFPATFTSKKAGAALGALAGALFGLFEIYDFSVLYNAMINAGILTSGVANTLLAARTVTSLPMHIIASLLFGLGVAFAAMSSARPSLKHIFSGNSMTFMALAVGFHIVYNLFNLIPSILLRSDIIGIILGFITMLAGLYMAYRVYHYVPSRLDQLQPLGLKDLVMNAMGWGAKKGAAVPEKRP